MTLKLTPFPGATRGGGVYLDKPLEIEIVNKSGIRCIDIGEDML